MTNLSVWLTHVIYIVFLDSVNYRNIFRLASVIGSEAFYSHHSIRAAHPPQPPYTPTTASEHTHHSIITHPCTLLFTRTYFPYTTTESSHTLSIFSQQPQTPTSYLHTTHSIFTHLQHLIHHHSILYTHCSIKTHHHIIIYTPNTSLLVVHPYSTIPRTKALSHTSASLTHTTVTSHPQHIHNPLHHYIPTLYTYTLYIILNTYQFQ